MAQQVFLGRRHGVRFAFIHGQIADKLQYLRYIRGRSRSDRQSHTLYFMGVIRATTETRARVLAWIPELHRTQQHIASSTAASPAGSETVSAALFRAPALVLTVGLV